MANDWKQLFRYKPTDKYNNVYARAYHQIKLAKSFAPSSVPALERALANAKKYFDSKKKKPVISRTGGYISNKNRNAIVRRMRA